jgi:MORN repeat variant
MAAPQEELPLLRHLGVAALLGCTLLAGCQKRVQRSWPSGSPRFEGRISRIDGEREGPWSFWFPNGRLREQGSYTDGRRVGRWRQWHANGQPRCEGERSGEAADERSPRTGYWRFWYENGKPEAQGVFVRGLREGRWDYHLTDGELDGDRSGEYHLDQLLR